jgi:hypothetical protein
MKIEAKTIDEFFDNSLEKKEDIMLIDKMLKESLPQLERQLFSGDTITLLGYGKMDWFNKQESGVWPLISIAPQKNYISIYIAAKKEDVYLPEFYKDRLGKVSIGKNCIRIGKLKNVNIEVLLELFYTAYEWSLEEKQKYGRNCAKPI